MSISDFTLQFQNFWWTQLTILRINMSIVNREKTKKGHPWSQAHQQGPQALATMSQK